jgi:hypothetical protein
LGLAYERETDVIKNTSFARHYFVKAANQGLAPSKEKLALSENSPGVVVSQSNAGSDAMSKVYGMLKVELESPELNSIKGKLAFLPNVITLQQLSEATKPSPAEKKALEKYVDIRRRYKDGDLKAHETQYPLFLALRTEYHRNHDFALADLYGGRLTYGEFNRKYQEIWDDFRLRAGRIAAERNRLEEENRRAAAANAQRSAVKQARCQTLRNTFEARNKEVNSFQNWMADVSAWGANDGARAFHQQKRAEAKAQLEALQLQIATECAGL